MKDLKEIIASLDEKMDEMEKSKMTRKEQQEYDELNDLRYSFAQKLEIMQLEAKVKRLETKIKRLEA